MNGSILIVVALLSSASRGLTATTGFESVPFRFYEQLVNVRLVSEQCRTDIVDLLDRANNLDKWALEIIDSSAKIPSGILRGNLNQFGDFDQCVSAVDNDRGVSGKYCLAAVQSKQQSVYTDAIYAHRMFKNNLTDPGNIIPKICTVYWGVCVPSSCRPDDVTFAMESAVRAFHDVVVLVEDDMCQVKRTTNIDWMQICVTILIILAVIPIVQKVVCMTVDLKHDVEAKASLTTRIVCVTRNSFALKTNFQSLFVTPVRSGFSSLHGIRTLNMILLLIFHMLINKLLLPYFNKTEIIEHISKPWMIIGRVANLYTDSFLVISGLLTAYTLSRSSPIKSVVARYIRLTATQVTVIVIFTKYLPDMNDGPMWNMVVKRHAELCYRYWWRNLLYIQNLFGFNNMCLPHMHQLAIDFQLFAMAIPLTYLLRKSKPVALYTIAAIMCVSTALRYHVVKANDLATVVYFGSNISQLNRSFDLTYTLPTHRATVYLMGYLVGYWMQQGGRLNMSSARVKNTWLVAAVCGLLAIFGWYRLSSMDYVYNSEHLAIFNAAAPVLWSVFVLWTIVATDNGYGGWFGKLLCWPPFTVFSNISYAVYLVQYPVFFYFSGSTRGSSLFTVTSMVNFGEMVLIAGLSICLTLVVDIPFQKISKHLTMDGTSPKTIKSSK